MRAPVCLLSRQRPVGKVNEAFQDQSLQSSLSLFSAQTIQRDEIYRIGNDIAGTSLAIFCLPLFFFPSGNITSARTAVSFNSVVWAPAT